MDIFLRLKHWHLFLLLFGIPVMFDIVGTAAMISSHNLSFMFSGFSVMMILFMGVYLGWFYAMGTALNTKLPPDVKMNLTKFKVLLFIPAAYMLSLCVFMFGPLKHYFFGSQPSPAIALLIVSLHLISMFGMFYSLYFVSKSLKAVEVQKPVTFSDFAGEFFLIWFFPVGVWLIQPRINKLFDETTESCTISQ